MDQREDIKVGDLIHMEVMDHTNMVVMINIGNLDTIQVTIHLVAVKNIGDMTSHLEC